MGSMVRMKVAKVKSTIGYMASGNRHVMVIDTDEPLTPEQVIRSIIRSDKWQEVLKASEVPTGKTINMCVHGEPNELLLRAALDEPEAKVISIGFGQTTAS